MPAPKDKLSLTPDTPVLLKPHGAMESHTRTRKRPCHEDSDLLMPTLEPQACCFLNKL
jgi:hypothetical protein